LKRLKWLAILGLLLFIALAYKVITSDGRIPTGLEVEFVTDLRDWDNPQREVLLYGPDVLGDLLASRMELTPDNGWQRAAETDKEGFPYLRLWKESSEGRIPDWSWSKSSLDSTAGLFSDEYVYMECFTRGLFAKIYSVRHDWLRNMTNEERKTIKEEFMAALKETGHRIDIAFDDLVLDPEIRMRVRMPTRIQDCRGFENNSPNGNTICLTARRSQIKPDMQLRVVASGASAWGYVSITLLAAIVAGILYVILQRRRKRKFLDRLRAGVADMEDE